MNRHFWPLLPAVCVLTGCFTRANTQLPKLVPDDPQAEARSISFHDPFPDNTIGPEVTARPRSFLIQRTLERRAAENRLLRGYNLQQAPRGPVPPRTSYDYPQAVESR